MKSPASIFFWDYFVYVDMSVFHMLRTYDVMCLLGAGAVVPAVKPSPTMPASYSQTSGTALC